MRKDEGSNQGPRCARCKKYFTNDSDLEDHSKGVCDYVSAMIGTPADPEDGITAKIANILSARSDGEKVKDWPGLWRTLFPDDADIPDQCE